MNEPFLLSNLIDLQEIDNKIYRLENDKKGSENVLKLMSLESEFKEVTKKIQTQKKLWKTITKRLKKLPELINQLYKKFQV